MESIKRYSTKFENKLSRFRGPSYIEKTRIGSKVTKKYDEPKTPYQRILTSVTVSEEVKEKLKRYMKN
jgi:hypothetical protein